MSSGQRNPFMNNTPSSSPLKPTDGSRITKRPLMGSSNSSLLFSPSRKNKTAGSVIYADRFLPTRTDIDLNMMASIGHYSRTPLLMPSNTEDQVEFHKERQAHETFDAVLKNELFGEKLQRDTIGTETSIDRIQHTRLNYDRTQHDINGLQTHDEAVTPPDTASNFGLDRDSHYNAASNNNSNNNDINDHYSSNDNGNINSNHSGGSSSSSNPTTTSVPVTPRRMLPMHDTDLQRPSSSSVRGASLLTYREQMSVRPSTSTMLQSQFFDSVSPVRPDSKKLLLTPGRKIRHIAKVPYRVLDAPSLADDFYYDLIDWSSTDVLAVALGKSIFLTDNNTGEVVHLCDTKNEYTSLSWVGAGSHLAVGQADGLVEIYDITRRKCIKTLTGHLDRVACLSWNNYILSSGSRDRRIFHRDVRMPEPFFDYIESHTQEVCGLKWNVEENKLASGGNDNTVFVYDGISRNPFMRIDEHTAAVKALAWSPHKRATLATGGGTADRRLKIWNINACSKTNDVDTGSQVCNMIWSRNTDEIVTSHGYSRYNLTLWNTATMDPVAILKGHSFRVLHLTLSADGTTVVSGAGDETLRYWKLFDKAAPKSPAKSEIFQAFNQIR